MKVLSLGFSSGLSWRQSSSSSLRSSSSLGFGPCLVLGLDAGSRLSGYCQITLFESSKEIN